MKFLFLSFFIITTTSLMIFPSAFAEGGGGLDCPQRSANYIYLLGTADYQVNSFDEGEIAVLFCEYMIELPGDELDIFGEINVVYHVQGQLSQELVKQYGCGAVLAEQYSPTYVSSSNNFATAAYSTDGLLEAATVVISQIEGLNLATSCIEQVTQESTAEIVKEAIEEHEVIEDSSAEIIKEEAEKIVKLEPIVVQESKVPEIVLPDWIKNNAGWWSSDQITSTDFSLGIEFMINEGFIKIPPTEVTGESSNEIPDWVKNNAGWWAEGLISDNEFVNGLQFLISAGIIQVS